MATHSEARTLASCPAVVFITYTPGPGAEERGYEKWLREVDNPFFNDIPGIRHYANWQVERVLAGGELGYGYIDFQGLETQADLERVWFNADLDRFRKEWVRLWGYAGAKPSPLFAYAYLMRKVKESGRGAARYARVSAGIGAAPAGFDLAWQMEKAIHKHFAGASEEPWLQDIAARNPLGLEWIGLEYGDNPAVWQEAAAPVSYVARVLAAPDGSAA